MENIKKVVFQINDISISGGAERVVTSWVNYLSENYKEIDVELLTCVNSSGFYNINKNVIVKSLNINIDERSYVAADGILQKIGCLLKEISPMRLAKIIRYFRTLNKNDVVIINKFELIRPLWLLRNMGLFRNIKIIYFYHGCSDSYLKNLSNANRKFIFETADKVIFLFDNKVYDLKNINKNKIRVLHNPLPFRSSNICNLDSKSILCVGRLSEEKGIDLLLRSWAEISNNYDWKLVIVGDGDKKQELINICKELGIENSVVFKGQQDDVKKYYLESSIYAMTSKTEGMPMVLLEAMECGMPIIAFNIPATNYLINGVGVLVDNFSIDDYSSKLEQLIKSYDYRSELSKKSKVKASEFGIDKILKDLAEILDI